MGNLKYANAQPFLSLDSTLILSKFSLNLFPYLWRHTLDYYYCCIYFMAAVVLKRGLLKSLYVLDDKF